MNTFFRKLAKNEGVRVSLLSAVLVSGISALAWLAGQKPPPTENPPECLDSDW